MEGNTPPYSIRRTGFAGSRRVFAEVSLPSESENSYLADFAPGKSLIFSKIRISNDTNSFVSFEGLCNSPLISVTQKLSAAVSRPVR